MNKIKLKQEGRLETEIFYIDTDVDEENDGGLRYHKNADNGSTYAADYYAVTISKENKIKLAGAEDPILGRLERVEPDGLCTVAVRGDKMYLRKAGVVSEGQKFVGYSDSDRGKVGQGRSFTYTTILAAAVSSTSTYNGEVYYSADNADPTSTTIKISGVVNYTWDDERTEEHNYYSIVLLEGATVASFTPPAPLDKLQDPILYLAQGLAFPPFYDPSIHTLDSYLDTYWIYSDNNEIISTELANANIFAGLSVAANSNHPNARGLITDNSHDDLVLVSFP